MVKAANAGPASDVDAASPPFSCIAFPQNQLAAQKFGIADHVEAACFACILFLVSLVLAAFNAEASFWVQGKVAVDGDAGGVDPATVAGSLHVQLPCEDQVALEAHGSPKEQLGTSRPTTSRLLGLSS